MGFMEPDVDGSECIVSTLDPKVLRRRGSPTLTPAFFGTSGGNSFLGTPRREAYHLYTHGDDFIRPPRRIEAVIPECAKKYGQFSIWAVLKLRRS